MTGHEAAPYRVLARKYRPQSFADVVGQPALVRTLSNAIESGRLPHGIILTGVRGVGKTTTARLIARAINYVGPEGRGGPTSGPTDDCPICRAIAEDRHPDVVEMDAASRTGVEDIREIIESVRYRPIEARYKVYIIDEVHMLSTKAFNALLKTLEEPPERVLFIFATTEIRKVPVTVLSRCMRFDLKRLEQEELAAHLGRIAVREEIAIEADALALIARAADGSARDGLSLLDQAIAIGGERVDAATVRAMLGLSDRAEVYDLLEGVLRGAIAETLERLNDLYARGSDPLMVLQDLLEATHAASRAKVLPESADAGLPELERRRARELAGRLSVPALARAWQMLLKGLEEAQRAPSALKAAEMLLIRLAYASELPTPGDLVRRLAGKDARTAVSLPGDSLPASREARPEPLSGPSPGGETLHRTPQARSGALPARQPGRERPQEVPEPQAGQRHPEPEAKRQPESLAEVAELLAAKGELRLSNHLRTDAHLVSFEAGRIELRPTDAAPRDLAGQLGRLLTEWCGRRWIVSLSEAPGAPSLAEQQRFDEARLRQEALAHPLVQAALAAFPGAEILSVAAQEGEPAGLAAAGEGSAGELEGEEEA